MNFRKYFRRNDRDAELTQEIDFHLAEEIEANLARGMSRDEARRRALVKFGNPQRVHEDLWQQNTMLMLDSIWRDLKYAARTLARSPGFSLMGILVMALGIGGNVALFTVVRSVLLNPLPYPDSGQLFTIYEHEDNHKISEYLPVDGGSFTEWQKATVGMAQMALVSPWQVFNISAEGGKLPERIDASWCSWNFFSTLGIAPLLGRDFAPSDDRPDAAATVILSAPFWRRRYDSDPKVVGKDIWLDGKPYTVIGVLPESFAYSGAFSGNTAAVWTPVGHESMPAMLSTFEDHEFLAVARLPKGGSLAGLLSRLDTVQKGIKAEHPGPAVHESVIGRTMLDDAVHEYKTPLYALLAATSCVLLIACLNIASLLVARSSARSKELAIRAAMGGSRLRLLRERLMESFVLSTAGGSLGLLLAWGALQWLVRMRQDLNRVEAIHIDGVGAVFTIGAMALCALFSGLISALSSDRKQILTSLQESSRAHSAGLARVGLRRILLVMEVALTVVLLVGAGLMLKSYQRLRNVDIGVPTDNVLTMHFSLPDTRYREPAQQVAFFESLIQRVRSLPGVQAAGLVSTAPGQGWGGDTLMAVPEHPPLPKGQGLDLMRRGAEPGYFSALQIPLLAGRTFAQTERLEHARVTILSKAAAELCFPGENPIGKHLKDTNSNQVFEVVGVVGDTRWRISQPVQATMYWPLYGNDYSVATIVVRASHDVESLAMPVQKLIGELDSDLPVSNVMTLRETINRSTIGSQFDSFLVLAFALIALLLAAAGLYGVVAYLVTQRTSEIGIRIALGARREQVLRLILADGLQPAILGLIVGLAASAAAVRLITAMLYETRPLDPVVFLAVSGTLLMMAILACAIPAWRASRLDPMTALRTE